jgi:hypothetical protein
MIIPQIDMHVSKSVDIVGRDNCLKNKMELNQLGNGHLLSGLLYTVVDY